MRCGRGCPEWGGRTPVVVTEEMVSNMRPGTVIVDVSIDRGGCFETSMVTTHENPVFRKVRCDPLLCTQYPQRVRAHGFHRPSATC